MRLQKFLSRAGICSRRKGEEYIKAGWVKVNGKIVTELGVKVDPERDAVEVDSDAIGSVSTPIYIALNKPSGYVSSCYQQNEKIVLDLLDISERVYPVGRLDKDSTGLLLLTNDGRLHHRLSHPSFNHEKEYEVTVARPLPEGALRKLAKGLPMMGTRTRPARVKRISSRRFRIESLFTSSSPAVPSRLREARGAGLSHRAQASRERMFALSPEERLTITELLRRQLYPDGVEPDFQRSVKVVQR